MRYGSEQKKLAAIPHGWRGYRDGLSAAASGAAMEFDDLLTWIRANLADIRVLIASEENGARRSSWGDAFVMHELPTARPTDLPFATIIIQDQPGFDDRSRLDRAGAFRVNIQIGRDRAVELLGESGRGKDNDDMDFAEVDRLLPHPVYASHGYVCVVNPGPAATDLVHQLLREAHARTRARLQRRW